MVYDLQTLTESVLTPLSIAFTHGTLEFSHPLVILLLPLPWLVRRWVPPHRTLLDALHAPFFREVTQAANLPVHEGAIILAWRLPEAILGILAWLCLLGALSQPHWVDPPLEKIIPGRDLLLAVDISQSMEERDFTSPTGKRMDRLSAARLVLDDFAGQRHGDRLGLVVFANGAHVQAPFTLDHRLLRQLLTETQTGMAGPRTMIGDAIGLGIRLFENSNAKHKVMILLTDGADTGSRIPPEVAARIAAQRGITIHAIAIGDPQAKGSDKVDSAALQQIAKIAGGRFAVGQNLAQLQAIYRELGTLEQQEFTVLTHREKHPLYFWPAGMAILFGLLAHGLAALRVLSPNTGRANRDRPMATGDV